MVLVDTGVWIDFLAGTETKEVRLLILLLEQEESIAFTGQILQELMQGCSNDKDAQRIEDYFLPFVEIRPQRSSYRLAAKIFRDCRFNSLEIGLSRASLTTERLPYQLTPTRRYADTPTRRDNVAFGCGSAALCDSATFA